MAAALGAVPALSVPDEAAQRTFWNEWNAKYRGVEKMLPFAKARERYPQIPFECGDFAKVELNSGRFDFVISLDTLSHVADRGAFVRRVRQVLTPGGYLMLTIQNRFVFERRSDVDQQSVGQVSPLAIEGGVA